ncbi:arginase family protein [Acidaminococcus intestini]|nr:arginase family protein [Acidaminococcus intestini]
MRNAAGLPYVGRILHLGVRGIGSSGPDDFEEAREHGDQIYSCRDVRRLGIDRILKEFGLAKQFVVCFDIDAMDAVYAPATGSPCSAVSITMKRSISLKPLARQATSKELS